MVKGRFPTVQRLSADQRIVFLTVKKIAEHRCAEMRKMHAELMGSAGNGARLHQRMPVLHGKHAVFCVCRICIRNVRSAYLAHDNAFFCTM